MIVCMNAFAEEPSSLVEQELAAVERVIRSGRWLPGSEMAATARLHSDPAACRWLSITPELPVETVHIHAGTTAPCVP